MLEAERLKGESDRGIRGKKKQKEEKHLSSSTQQTPNYKLDEMSKMINRLTSKLEKLEMEEKTPPRLVQEGGKINQNPYMRPFQPIRFYREI